MPVTFGVAVHAFASTVHAVNILWYATRHSNTKATGPCHPRTRREYFKFLDEFSNNVH